MEPNNDAVHAEHMLGIELLDMFKKDERFRHRQRYSTASSMLDVDMSDLDSRLNNRAQCQSTRWPDCRAAAPVLGATT